MKGSEGIQKEKVLKKKKQSDRLFHVILLRRELPRSERRQKTDCTFSPSLCLLAPSFQDIEPFAYSRSFFPRLCQCDIHQAKSKKAEAITRRPPTWTSIKSLSCKFPFLQAGSFRSKGDMVAPSKEKKKAGVQKEGKFGSSSSSS